MRIPRRVQCLDLRSKAFVVVEGPLSSRRQIRDGRDVSFAHPGDFLLVGPDGGRTVIAPPELELYYEWIRDL